MKMKVLKLLPAVGLVGLLGGCATHPVDTSKLDAKISAATADDFGQFMYHEALSEENLAEARKIRQWNKDGHYWNINTEQHALAAGDRALKHRQMAEKALEAWHDRCVRHPDICIKEEMLTAALFDTGSSSAKTVKQETINHIIKLSKIHHQLEVEVIGFTDTVGSATSNKHLAAHRANTIHDLLHKHGINSHTVVKTIPFGEATGADNVANQQNRRVDVRVRTYQPYPK